MRLTADGKLGLGISSPVVKLDISEQATGSNVTQIRLQNGSASLGTHGTAIKFQGFYDTALISSDGDPTNTTGGTLRLQTYSNNGVLNTGINITRTGLVGIGTTSPGYPLSIFNNGSNQIQLSKTGDAVAGSLIGRANITDELRIQNSENAPITFLTNNTERARIDSSGRLLVGTSSTSQFARAVFQGNSFGASQPCDIYFQRDTAGTGLSVGTRIANLLFADNTGNQFASILVDADAATSAGDFPGRLVFSTTADGASSPTERCRIDSGGNLLVGQTSSDAKIAVTYTGGASLNGIRLNTADAGTSTAVQFVYNASTQVGTITTTTTATAYNTSSDYRLKENVVPLTGAIDRLQQIPVHRFNFIADPDKTVDGFIAHEAQAVVPECVTGTKDEVDADGNPVYQGIDQSKLVPLLTAALQDAIAEITTLKDRVAALEAA
jgi:hypothetical protein